MPPHNEQFPSVAQAALLLLANFLLEYIIGVLFYDFRGTVGVTSAQAQALVVLLANGIVLVSVMHYRGMGYRDLVHPAKASIPVTLLLLLPPVFLLVPLVLLLDHQLMLLVQQLIPMSRWEEQAFTRMVAANLPTVVAACVLAPVLEEMLFRGVLLRAFLQKYPRWAAISYSALLFGAAHLNVYQFLFASALGLLLGWLYERSRSLLPCIALHAAVNTTIVMLEATKASPGEEVLSDASVALWLGAALAAIAGGLALRRLLVGTSRRSTDTA
ncbi:CPBP family intramembrane metalloprotease [Ramlibacter sp. G-1-2-2]|uniref:CPBP family intramembrane metalloprotease n=1 Tax=Ramlibacter agri TaxID=2728837 RepID=A0A848H1S9_9BURK|nr:CPBP family intramembrane glutamic endopeptidase [Ramlibacter agri]NML43531.1 CPBP family intramembrane metalloprotease [Ramlibacter agri]